MPYDALLHQGKPGALVLPPFKAPAYATPQQRNMALFTRRSHPLYRDVTFRLLSEVINSRLFRTVRSLLPTQRSQIYSHHALSCSLLGCCGPQLHDSVVHNWLRAQVLAACTGNG